MFRYIKYSSLCSLIALALLFSCSKDLGNYDYKDINEIQITGLDSTYVSLFGEPIKIIPELDFSQDSEGADSNYTYEWFAINQDLSTLNTDKRTDIVNTRNLDLESLLLPPGNYDINYNVTDTNTGVQWHKTFTLIVESSIQKGLMVLNDVQGKARLDMISLVNEEYNPIYDVLDYTGSSLRLEGAPINVACYAYDYQFYGVYVNTTGNGTTKIHPESFDWDNTYRLSFEMLTNVPTDYGADFIEPVEGLQSFMYKDGDVFYYYRTRSIRYGVPINFIEADNAKFNAAPFIGYGDVTVLYDVDKKRFVRFTEGGSVSFEMPTGDLFDYNTGKDLIYMAKSSYNGGEVFAILKDPADAKFYLARIRSRRNIRQQYYGEIPDEVALQMDQADQFAISPDFGYIFYNVGGKVYEYDFNSQKSKLMIDKGAGNITVLQFERYAPYSKDLIVGSYDSGTTEGTIEVYKVPAVNGDLELSQSYSGFGKVVSVAYKTE
ncbi:hypothetical protein JM658_03765 [Joostella atrarenae]|uniref:PKD-like family protein n=1 Tax=Joostella atrarenae TaxID=679257 RepID=A0ABS9J0G8_9FLAO|nr:PKD-like family lipoprotein [Joostella atrarenae]MCF8713936.1 hypothetical protein [Joostella atrarenae]